MSIIFCISLNFSLPVELVITQNDNHVKMKFTPQLTNGVSRVLEKLLKYFNGIIISLSFVLPSAGTFLLFLF